MVAVGQGAKGNPWIFRELKNGPGLPDLAERIQVCKTHLELYVDWIGEQRAVLEMRKHACWYLKGFDGAAGFRKRLGDATSIDAFHQLLDQIPWDGH
jgi:tRNA-dihydrouridine synthase